MPKADRLTQKQQRFVEEYLVTFNATEAASRAGYKGNRRTLAVVGHENLTKDYIRKEIQEHLSEMSDKARAAAREVLSKVHENGDRISRGMNQKQGIVYIIREEHGAFKIGKTINLGRRMATLNTYVPYDLELIMAIESNEAAVLESELHQQFDEYRIKGEWFALDDADIEKIKQSYVFDK